MKKLVLYFLTVYDNAIRNLILLLGCFISCMLLLGILYSADEYITIFSYAKNGHIEDYVFVSDNIPVEKLIYNNTSSSDSDYTLENVLESLGGVEASYFAANLQVVDLERFDEDGENLMLNIAYPGTPSFNEMKMRIAEGRLPEAKNEIVMCHEAKARYYLGETILLGYMDIHKDYMDYRPLTVKVVGFMPKNPISKDVTNCIVPSNSLEALKIIEEGKGTQFDPKCVEVFLEALPDIKNVLKRYKPSKSS